MSRIRPLWTPVSDDNANTARVLGYDVSWDVGHAVDGLWWYHKSSVPLPSTVNAYLYEAAGPTLAASILGVDSSGWFSNAWNFIDLGTPCNVSAGVIYTVAVGIVGGLAFDSDDLAANIVDGTGHATALAHTGRFANGTSTGYPSNTWDGMFGIDVEFRLGGITQAIGTAAETDSARPLGRLKSRAFGVSTESDTARPLARVKRRAVGTAAETDTALALGGADTPAPPPRFDVGQPRSSWSVGQPRSPWSLGPIQ
jgi:hypothetical protein